MVNKKELLSDLKKFNKELDNHFKEVDFTFTKEIIGSELSESDQINSILASNILDLKTEVSLIRKNLVQETEGMVKKILYEEQSKFIKETNDILTRVSLDFKESLNKVIEEIQENNSKISSKFDFFEAQNKRFESNLEELSKDLRELGKVSLFVDNLEKKEENNFKKVFELMNKKFELINLEFSSLKKELGLLKKEISKKDLSKKVKEVAYASEKSSIKKEYEIPEVELDLDLNTTTSKIIDIEEKLKKLEAIR